MYNFVEQLMLQLLCKGITTVVLNAHVKVFICSEATVVCFQRMDCHLVDSLRAFRHLEKTKWALPWCRGGYMLYHRRRASHLWKDFILPNNYTAIQNQKVTNYLVYSSTKASRSVVTARTKTKTLDFIQFHQNLSKIIMTPAGNEGSRNGPLDL